MAIVGVGLIGGSIGLAVRERKLARQVIGIGRDEAQTGQCLSPGSDRRRHHVARPRRGRGPAGHRLHAGRLDRRLRESRRRPLSANRTLITDAGSTKASIVRIGRAAAGRSPRWAAVRRQPSAGRRPSHGRRLARGDLFEGRKVIVTPTEKTHRAAVVGDRRLLAEPGGRRGDR